jgi:hypothetical protein
VGLRLNLGCSAIAQRFFPIMPDSIYPLHIAAQNSSDSVPSVNPLALSGNSGLLQKKEPTPDVGKTPQVEGKFDDDMPKVKEVKASLLVRTTPAVRKNIHDAAKLKGLSINAWIDQILDKAAQEQLLEASGTTSKPPSLRLLDDESDELAALVDDVLPRLKSQKAASIFAFIGAVETLQLGMIALRQCLRDDRIDTASEFINAIYPFLHQPNDLVTPEFGEAMAQFFEGLKEVRKCIKGEDTQSTWQVLDQIINFFQTVDPKVSATDPKINPK